MVQSVFEGKEAALLYLAERIPFPLCEKRHFQPVPLNIRAHFELSGTLKTQTNKIRFRFLANF